MDRAKLGIIGLGRMGRKHAANIHYSIPNAELTAICSVVEEELDSVAREMNPKYSTSNFMELIENHELEKKRVDRGLLLLSNMKILREIRIGEEKGYMNKFLKHMKQSVKIF